MGIRHFLVFAVSFLCLISCRPSGIKEKVERPDTYSQGFKTDHAWIVLEWNGKIYGYGSGFLIDKNRGAFYSNKHVSGMFDQLGRGSHKIFFNGRIYNASIVKTPSLVDAALIQITDSFDPADFPEPSPISSFSVKMGERLTIGGFHPHPYSIRKADEAEGFNFPLLTIYRDHYRMPMLDKDKEQEVVFEQVDGLVVKLDSTANDIIEGCKAYRQIDNNPDFITSVRNRSNLYIKLKLLKDHRFPFGGLSGSPVKNQSGEIVGITTMQDPCRVDWLNSTEDGALIGKLVFDTIFIAPIKAVDDLRKFLK